MTVYIIWLISEIPLLRQLKSCFLDFFICAGTYLHINQRIKQSIKQHMQTCTYRRIKAGKEELQMLTASVRTRHLPVCMLIFF